MFPEERRIKRRKALDMRSSFCLVARL